MNENKPKPLYAPTQSNSLVKGVSTTVVRPKNEYTHDEILKILSNKSPGLYSNTIGRFDSDPGGWRIDILTGDGKLAMHFHPLPENPNRPKNTPVTTPNAQGDTEFVVHAEPIIRQLMKEIEYIKQKDKAV